MWPGVLHPRRLWQSSSRDLWSQVAGGYSWCLREKIQFYCWGGEGGRAGVLKHFPSTLTQDCKMVQKNMFSAFSDRQAGMEWIFDPLSFFTSNLFLRLPRNKICNWGLVIPQPGRKISLPKSTHRDTLCTSNQGFYSTCSSQKVPDHDDVCFCWNRALRMWC